MQLIHRTEQLDASPIATAHAWLAHRQSDRRLLDLSQAAPAYPTAPEIAATIARIAASPDGGRYAPPPGLPALTSAFAAELSRDFGATVESRNVVPTGGCNQAFCVVTSALATPGDEIILPLPYYFNHDMWLRLDGVTPIHLESGDGLIPDPEAARSLITERTRAIVLVTPGNPSGVTIPPAVIGQFYDLAESHGIALIVDETYRNFRETTEPSHDLFTRPDWDQTFVGLHSFSKDLAIPGYRVGAVVAGPELLGEVLKLIDCVQICAPRVGQEAVVTGLTEAMDWRQEQRTRILANLERFRATMATRPGGFDLVTSGAFFGWIRHPFPDVATEEVVRRLVLDHDVLVIPGTAFMPRDDRWLRFSYANLDGDDFDLLAERLIEAGSP